MIAKTTAENLHIRAYATVWSSHTARLDLIAPLPEGVRPVDGPEQAAIALVFVDDAVSLREILAAHGDHLSRPDALWIAYPKAHGGALNRDTLSPILGEYGLRPVGRVPVDEVWSAMRFRPCGQGEATIAGSG